MDFREASEVANLKEEDKEFQSLIEEGRKDDENKGDTSLYLTVTKLQVTKP